MVKRYLFDNPADERRMRDIVDMLTANAFICQAAGYNPAVLDMSEEDRKTMLEFSTEIANDLSNEAGVDPVSLEENLVNDGKPIFRDEKLDMILRNDGTIILPTADALLAAEKEGYSFVLYDEEASEAAMEMINETKSARTFKIHRYDSNPLALITGKGKNLTLVGVNKGTFPDIEMITDLYIHSLKRFECVGDTQRISPFYENIRFENQEEALLKALRR